MYVRYPYFRASFDPGSGEPAPIRTLRDRGRSAVCFQARGSAGDIPSLGRGKGNSGATRALASRQHGYRSQSSDRLDSRARMAPAGRPRADSGVLRRAGQRMARGRRYLREIQRPSALRRRNSTARSIRRSFLMSSNTLTRIALCVASGLALGLAFPKFDLSLLAWVAFIPLFMVIEDQPLGRVFGWAWLAGLSAFIGSMYWIAIPLHDFADVWMPIAILPMLLLSAIMGLFSALAVWAGTFVERRLRIPAVVTMPIAWVAVEWTRTYFPIGFPWNL